MLLTSTDYRICYYKKFPCCVQALIDEGADPLVFDFQGNNVFTVLAKRGHLWTLNFIYQIIW